MMLAGCVAPGSSTEPMANSRDNGAIERGAYLATAANCRSCHTDTRPGAPPFAGGRAIVTPFGAYYSGNITPDTVDGIGSWSDADFLRALRQGAAPNGSFYFPAFPYPSFTRMTDRDILDIKAYLATQSPAAQPNRSPDALFPYNARPLLAVWRELYFTPGSYVPDPAQSAEWNRGAYLATAVAHCGECHTPRDALGGLVSDRPLTGTMAVKTGMRAPDITAHRPHGIGAWSVDDIADFLDTGIAPDGDAVGGAMTEVVNATSKLTPPDRRAIAVYIKSIPPRPAQATK